MISTGRVVGGLVVLLALVAGCGPELPHVVPVSGTVMYHGEPLAEAEVTFLRQDQPPGRGMTDGKGRFHLRTYIDPDYDLNGAMPGDYVVRIVKLESLVRPEDKSLAEVMARHPNGPKQLLPPRYADARATDLKAHVTEDGKNDFEFVLSD